MSRTISNCAGNLMVFHPQIAAATRVPPFVCARKNGEMCLEGGLVFAVGVELKIHRVAGQIEMHRVVGLDQHRAVA